MPTLAIESISQHTLTGLELVGTAAFAFSGVLGAMRKNMDMVGICVCGFLAAFGGGTLRDVLLDRRPFFWVEHQAVLIGVFVLCIACASFLRPAHLERSQHWMQIPDAIGLGLFCTTGIHLSWSMEQPMVVAMMMGVITATFGGVLRDIACNEIPQLFNDHRPYAVCALFGGVVYAAWRMVTPDAGWAVLACASVTIALRVLSLWFDWRLPAIRRSAD